MHIISILLLGTSFSYGAQHSAALNQYKTENPTIGSKHRTLTIAAQEGDCDRGTEALAGNSGYGFAYAASIINVADENGRQPVILATMHLNTNYLQLLCDRQANINVQDKMNKYSALHHLVRLEYGYREHLKKPQDFDVKAEILKVGTILKKYGIDTELTDNNEQTALEYAQQLEKNLQGSIRAEVMAMLRPNDQKKLEQKQQKP